MPSRILTSLIALALAASMAGFACSFIGGDDASETQSEAASSSAAATTGFLERAETAAFQAAGVDLAEAVDVAEALTEPITSPDQTEPAVQAVDSVPADTAPETVIDLTRGTDSVELQLIQADGSIRTVDITDLVARLGTDTAATGTSMMPDIERAAVATAISNVVERQPDFSTVSPTLTLTQPETLLTGIWERSINAVVLIDADSESGGFFMPSNTSTGAGFFWDDAGHIVTNAHVVQAINTGVSAADEIVVSTFSGDSYPAKVVGVDALSDLAVLKLTDGLPPDTHTLPIGDSDILIPGMSAIALGHPFGDGQDFSMTHGIVSGLDREIQTTRDYTALVPGIIQTDADVNPGNSGGPLLNSAGQVIGVNTQIRSYNNSNSGVGFALPSNHVARVVESIIQNGAPTRAWIGISTQDITPRVRMMAGLPDDITSGIYITLVYEATPASDAGLRGDRAFDDRNGVRITELEGGGDVIVAINGEQVSTLKDLRQVLLFQTAPGEVLEFTLVRDGERVIVPVVLGTREDGR